MLFQGNFIWISNIKNALHNYTYAVQFGFIYALKNQFKNVLKVIFLFKLFEKLKLYNFLIKQTKLKFVYPTQ